jgi:hypothetical protein
VPDVRRRVGVIDGGGDVVRFHGWKKRGGLVGASSAGGNCGGGTSPK